VKLTTHLHLVPRSNNGGNLREVENMVLKRIFGPKREEVVGGWRRLHNEELHNMYASPNVIHVFKSRRMRWAGYVARMGR
jgi:hypothetical protein